MALDTTSLNPGVGGSKVLHDSLTTADGGAAPTSAVAPIHKLAFGDAGDARQVSPSYGFPVGGQPAGYAPSYGSASGDGGSLAFDPSGQLVARATVLTDEGTARVNFANASLSVGIGSPTMGGLRVTGFTAGSDVHAGDYFKYDGDAESSWARIDGFDSTGAIVLESNYSGFPSGTASRALVKPFTGAGGALAVASGDTGVPVWGVRRDALTTSSSAAADYNEFAFNRFGAAYVTDFRLLARTYRALTAAFTLAAAATDVWDLFGNVTTTVVVTRIRVYGTQTTGGTADIRVRLRTTANSAGTRVASTVVKLEQADAAASSTPGHYTANPTVGTDAGAIAGGVIYLPAPANGVGFIELALGDKGKGVVLSGTAQGIAVSLGGTTPTGGAIGIEVEWYEF